MIKEQNICQIMGSSHPPSLALQPDLSPDATVLQRGGNLSAMAGQKCAFYSTCSPARLGCHVPLWRNLFQTPEPSQACQVSKDCASSETLQPSVIPLSPTNQPPSSLSTSSYCSIVLFPLLGADATIASHCFICWWHSKSLFHLRLRLPCSSSCMSSLTGILALFASSTPTTTPITTTRHGRA